MKNRRPSYWRAFWVTAAFIAALNVAASIYVLNCPVAPIGKGGEPERVISDWAMPIVAVDLPGIILTLPFWFGRIGSESESPATIIAVQVISTVFWGLVAVAVEWRRFGYLPRLVDPAVSTPAAASDSN
jgi:hypothetical protein